VKLSGVLGYEAGAGRDSYSNANGPELDGPAAYLERVIRREHFTEAEQIEISDGNSHR